MLDVFHGLERLCGVYAGRNHIKEVIKLSINIGLVIYFWIGLILHLFNVMSDPIATVSNVTDALYSAQALTNFGFNFFGYIVEYTNKAVLMVSGYLIASFLITMSGQKLIDKSESVGFAAYNMKWYDTDLSTRKYILFIVMRSQQPLTYKPGPFGTLSLPVFKSILGGAYTYTTTQASVVDIFHPSNYSGKIIY